MGSDRDTKRLRPLCAGGFFFERIGFFERLGEFVCSKSLVNHQILAFETVDMLRITRWELRSFPRLRGFERRRCQYCFSCLA